MNERRGRGEPRCKTGKLLTANQAVLWSLAKARLRALIFIETRILSLMSGITNFAWLLFVFVPAAWLDNPLVGFLERVTFGAPVEVILPPLAILAFAEVWGALFNVFAYRMVASIVSVFWWAWLCALMYSTPTNESAAIMLTVFTFFRSWTFVTINYTHPEGSHYGKRVG